jgi:hypothetical protein
MKLALTTIVIVLGFGLTVLAQENTHRTPADEYRPGTLGALSESISTTTGVAISPLFGMGALGAWRYFTTPEGRSDRLDWFCHPAIWGTALLIGGILLLKSTGKVVIPSPLVAPVDAIDHLSRHTALPIVGISTALPASLRMVETVAAEAGAAGANVGSGRGVLVQASLVPLESLPGLVLAAGITLGIFAVVWMTFNAIDTLAMLCPIGPAELGAKIAKGSILLAIVVSAALSPWLALILCAGIILIAAKVAGWAYRITVFGFVLMHDFLLPRRARKLAEAGMHTPRVFLKCRAKKIPARTYGRLSRKDGALIFTYRPVFFAPARTVTVPEAKLQVVRGVVMGGLREETKNKNTVKGIFPRRYQKMEEALACTLGIKEIVDSPVMRGWKGVKLWCAENFQTGGPRPAKAG